MPPRERAKRGQIYYIDFPEHESRGTEQRNRRPWIILSSDYINLDKNIKGYIVAPLTTKIDKTSTPFRVIIETKIGGRPSQSLILLEQLRFISEERLEDKPLWALEGKTLVQLEPGLKYILHLL